MRVDLFDFELPERLIALEPCRPRDAARLLVVEGGHLQDRQVRDLPSLLRAGDVVVLNDTKVIKAQLAGLRLPREATRPLGSGPPAFGTRVSVTLHKRVGSNVWRAFAKPGRKLAEGDRLSFGEALAARVHRKLETGDVVLAFDRDGADLDAAIEAVGEPPLPPYIRSRREASPDDAADYQTVYADEAGSVAAPTAGLHLTPGLLDALGAQGIKTARVTLHVGAGTFLPVKSEDTDDHVMHAEWGVVSDETAAAVNDARERGGRIIALGTTALRLLESAAEGPGRLAPFKGETDIFITPGFDFQIADGLMTNFHLPRSTLFMLVSAFAGLDTMRAAYAHAIAQSYRFYSFGDGSLLWRARS